EMSPSAKNNFLQFFKQNNFVENKRFQHSPNTTYNLKINNFNQIPKVLKNLETLVKPYKRVKSFKDLDENLITKFLNYAN
ncbi:MAG: hypothetical protein ACC656_09270, partial [Candidatus Heimdallarchaeota archaeon]